ncbi:unnamed protein product [Thelazia callipaeda]|uniref:Spondin domain-containing protein n=1 Tax=Thelazia callipaeda TaxID=103827 RepID=A0A0N5CJS4_THECL|nr:unnamed protein product [Thelazia callipaeda]
MILLICILAVNSGLAKSVDWEAADQEFSPYVFTHYTLPFKYKNHAGEWFGYETAYIQNPNITNNVPSMFTHRIPLPPTTGQFGAWSNLADVTSNQENTWNFEKRVDSKVWWPRVSMSSSQI